MAEYPSISVNDPINFLLQKINKFVNMLVAYEEVSSSPNLFSTNSFAVSNFSMSPKTEISNRQLSPPWIRAEVIQNTGKEKIL